MKDGWLWAPFRYLIFSVSLSLLFHTKSAGAEPLWELGIFTAMSSVPQYAGSDESYVFPLVLPYVVYRGRHLKADRNGVRGEIYLNKRLTVDAGLSFDFPVNGNNKARQGMSELHLTGQAGPRFNLRLCCDDNQETLLLRLPARYVMDIRNESLGWVVEPVFEYSRDAIMNAGNYKFLVAAGAVLASEKYNDYYYSVTQSAATEEPSRIPCSGGSP